MVLNSKAIRLIQTPEMILEESTTKNNDEVDVDVGNAKNTNTKKTVSASNSSE